MTLQHNYCKRTLAGAIEDIRLEFVSNPKYRNLDLDFITFLIMNLGISEETANILNNIANENS